jgi:hypothetical protein
MRFLQNDPIGFKGGDPNLYRHEGDDPRNSLDPSGLEKVKISNDFPAQLDFADCFTDEQKKEILASFRDAAEKINNAYIALKDQWDDITAILTTRKPEGATKPMPPAWFVFLSGQEMVGGSPGTGGASWTRRNNRDFALSRFNRVLGELKNKDTVIPIACGTGNVESGRNAYVVFWHLGFTKIPANTINVTDRFYGRGKGAQCNDIAHELGRRALWLYDENTGAMWDDVYEWDHLVDSLSRLHDQINAAKK